MAVTLRQDELDEPVVACVRRDYTALLFYFSLAGLILG